MPYRHHCYACDAVSDRHDQRADAEAAQQDHRDTAHGGHAPRAGDRIERVHAHGRGDFRTGERWPIGAYIAGLVLLLAMLAECVG
ncbi:hypothetical protein [Streptomyces sp. WMMC897]|uniref:hypothetical protein n=1 Tax=Streptomyces sp. WMMC897 TaxID=3014782 RepID=UPI0022B72966|nr:hypothetical protein [Streptomyces sp. WMMC897]MCZ7413062.1 hypothetical protein [Streptomyces sp. WMMC897]MCZ7415466.1 hypothetical protein [Streptomyces sp. WMMC897]